MCWYQYLTMKYFLHDTSSFDDEKVTELYLKYGYEGLGLFYTTLEKLGKQEKPVKTSVLKAQLKVGKRLEKCWLFMEQIGLLSSNNGETFNKQLLNFSETYQIKKEKTREKVMEWRKKQADKDNVTDYVPVSNPHKVKLSKVNKSKYNIIPPTFEEVELRIKERNITSFTAELFFAKYEANGWIVGKTKMKNWDSALTYWNKNNFNHGDNNKPTQGQIKRINDLWGKKN